MPPLNTCSVPPRPIPDYSCVGIESIGPKVVLWTRTSSCLFLLYTARAPESNPQREVPTSFLSFRKLDQTSHFCSSHSSLACGGTLQGSLWGQWHFCSHPPMNFIRSMFLVKCSIYVLPELVLTHFILLSYPLFEKRALQRIMYPCRFFKQDVLLKYKGSSSLQIEDFRFIYYRWNSI